IMFPDATLADTPPRIAEFYKRLFDLWLKANRYKQTVHIRTIEDIASTLLGGYATSEGFGYQPVELCTVMTDGSIEPHDVLRIAGRGSTLTSFNIFDNAIEDVKKESHWKAARDASLDLSEKCRQCKFVEV